MNFIDIINSENDIEKLKKTAIENLGKLYRVQKAEKRNADIYEFILGSVDLSADFEFCDNPKVSIVIPVKNNFIITAALLQSIKKNAKGIDYEIIIADDNSTDEVSQIEYFFPNIKRIVNDTGIEGFVYNMNNAISKARGEYIFALNNYTLTLPGFLTELLNVMERDKSIGIAGAKNLDIQGLIQECGVNFEKALKINIIGQYEASTFLDDKEYIDCDYCSGCSILFRRDIWEKAGKFDINYAPAYYDDSDFAFNLKYNFGLKTVCVPKAKIYHYKGMTYDSSDAKSLLLRRNGAIFYKKWQKYLNS